MRRQVLKRESPLHVLGRRARLGNERLTNRCRDGKNQSLMLDSTIVRADQRAASSPKRRGQGSKAFSKRALRTEIPLLAHELGQPLAKSD
jgi:hypothetical protein